MEFIKIVDYGHKNQLGHLYVLSFSSKFYVTDLVTAVESKKLNQRSTVSSFFLFFCQFNHASSPS